MVTKTSTSSSAPASDAPASVSSASATSTATASSTVVATTPAATASDCLKAPPSGAASPSSVDASPDTSASAQRFTRVPPAVLQSVKASLTYRKSCLKRSKSSVLPPSTFCEDETPTAIITEDKAEKKEERKSVQKNRRRCWECKVKVGLTAVKCRCDYTFCGKHRYAEEHKCAFNFKTAGKRKLEEENPVVVPSKVARIN
ncbi:AN1-like Zinc finger [Phytophthora infestans]|uniref:AN1-like Zinc finger n=1 Tax=Phytophthora infestans TaxID=4787 RepID=A0A833THG4_PHYIN|nr:AN1-like Zinc finger [Phytophthora infestans]